MPSVTYDELSEGLQLIIDETKVILGDTDVNYPWFGVDVDADNDTYAILLKTVLSAINVTQPRTSFSVAGTPADVPNTLYDLMRIGLTVYAIEARMNRWIEIPRLQGYSGPYADESEFLSRWQSRLSDLRPIWNKAKNTQKLMFLPKGRVSVNMNSGHGTGIPSIMRSLPTWMMY